MRCAIVGEDLLLRLLVSYNGIGKELTPDEKEILLFALYNESEASGGLAKRATDECERIAKSQRLVKTK